jgi:protein phosphatase
VEPDLFAARIQPGDMVLLATDGLTRYANPEVIAAAARNAPDLTAACGALIEHAKQGGGADNITCMLLRVIDPTVSSQADSREADVAAI